MGAASSVPKKRPTYNVIRQALQSKQIVQPPRLPFDAYDKFSLVKLPGSIHASFNPTVFWTVGPWLIEKCSPEMTILSLESFAVRKFAIAPVGAAALLIHVTIINATWSKNGEFHVTMEKLSKTAKGVYAQVICSDFYQIDDNAKSTPQEIKSKSSRPKCEKMSAALKVISKYHAEKFAQLITYAKTVL